MTVSVRDARALPGDRRWIEGDASVGDEPVSDPASRSIVGALGAAVSTVTTSVEDATLTLPAASVAFAVRLWAPSASDELVMLHTPPVAVVVPSTVTPSVS